MEQLTLTAAQTYPSTTFWKISALHLDWTAARIDIVLLGTNGEQKTFSYTGATATTFMIALNKLNLSVQSLHSRIMTRLVADGFLAGSVTGIPD